MVDDERNDRVDQPAEESADTTPDETGDEPAGEGQAEPAAEGTGESQSESSDHGDVESSGSPEPQPSDAPPAEDPEQSNERSADTSADQPVPAPSAPKTDGSLPNWPRRIFWVLVVIAVLVLGRYGLGRLLSDWGAVRIDRLEDVQAAEVPADGTVDRLNVAVLNINHLLGSADGARLGYGKRRLKVRIDRIGSMLRDHQVDVAVLNEVPLDRSGMHGLDVPHWLAVSGGFAYRAQQRNVDVTFPFYHIRHGNLILSRYPITDARLFDLPTASSLRSMFVGDRDGLLATVRVGSQTIDVLGVQLVAGAEQEGTRAQGAERILERAEESQVPLLVAGDLQTMPASYPDAPQDPDYGNALSLLLQSRHFTSEPGMAGPLEAERLTFPAHVPQFIYDWILVPADWRISTRVLPQEVSDHRMLLARVTLPQ